MVFALESPQTYSPSEPHRLLTASCPSFVEQQFFGLNASRQELRMQQIVTAHRAHQEPAQRLLLDGIQFFNTLSD